MVASGSLVVCGPIPRCSTEYGKAIAKAKALTLERANTIVCIVGWQESFGEIWIQDKDMLHFVTEQYSKGNRLFLVNPESLYITEVDERSVLQ